MGNLIRDFIPEGEVTPADRKTSYARLHGGGIPDFVPADPADDDVGGLSPQERRAEREFRAQEALNAVVARSREVDVVEAVGKFVPRVSQYKTWRHLVAYIQRMPRVSMQYALVAVAATRTEAEQYEVFRRLTHPNKKLLEEYLERTAVPPQSAGDELDRPEESVREVHEIPEDTEESGEAVEAEGRQSEE